jgi:hypothetical protein
VTRWLKTGIVKQEEMAIARERSIKHFVKPDCRGNRGSAAVEDMWEDMICIRKLPIESFALDSALTLVGS